MGLMDVGNKLNNCYEENYRTTLVGMEPQFLDDPNFTRDQLLQSEDARSISDQISDFDEPDAMFAIERLIHDNEEVAASEMAYQARVDQIAEAGAQERKALHGNEAAFAASASRQRSFIGAENQLRHVFVGDNLAEDLRPEAMSNHIPDPKPSTGFTVTVKPRRCFTKSGR